MTTNEKRYYQGTGRRKTAVARVRLYPGGGDVMINGRTLDDYFGGRARLHTVAQSPLELTDNAGKFNVMIKVRGGGISGQADAIRHGISRALLDLSPEFRPVLKQAGFLTRDPRAKERKKPGLPRARRAKQYTKR